MRRWRTACSTILRWPESLSPNPPSTPQSRSICQCARGTCCNQIDGRCSMISSGNEMPKRCSSLSWTSMACRESPAQQFYVVIGTCSAPPSAHRWGEPSAPLRIGEIADLPIVFFVPPRQRPLSFDRSLYHVVQNAAIWIGRSDTVAVTVNRCEPKAACAHYAAPMTRQSGGLEIFSHGRAISTWPTINVTPCI